MREAWPFAVMMVLLVILTGFVSSSEPTGAFVANLPPSWDYTTDSFQSPVQIDLERAFFDADGNSLAFSVSTDPGVSAELSGNVVSISGAGSVVLTASDGQFMVSKTITTK
jgi:hypothetical protein